MESKKKQQVHLKNEIAELHQVEAELSAKKAGLTNAVRSRIDKHNEIVRKMQELRTEYRKKIELFRAFKSAIKTYKEQQIPLLMIQYRRHITATIAQINGLPFGLDTSIFKDFDALKIINVEKFPNLETQKDKFYDQQKLRLKSHLLKGLECSKINEVIFTMHFVVRYEDYFGELILFAFLFRKIENKFEYHFMSDKETNRLDKPEWIFSFLLKEFEESEKIVSLYLGIKEEFYRSEDAFARDHSIHTPNTPDLVKHVSFRTFALLSTACIHSKLYEILNVQSEQKRNLILHFASEFMKFNTSIRQAYGFSIPPSEVECVLADQQMEHLSRELSKIHQLSYVQWFRMYKKLAEELLGFIGTYYELNVSLSLDDLVDPIVQHARNLVSNLRFINREEITVVCFIFSEMEDFKDFITEEEIELRLNYRSVEKDISTDALDCISRFNSDLIDLIKNLASNDTENLLKKLYNFVYTSPETKRLFTVECSKTLDEYRGCAQFSTIEKVVAGLIDKHILEMVLFKIRFSSDEYLEFRLFYKKLRGIFKNYSWQSDEGCVALDGVFEDRILPGRVYKRIKSLYE